MRRPPMTPAPKARAASVPILGTVCVLGYAVARFAMSGKP